MRLRTLTALFVAAFVLATLLTGYAMFTASRGAIVRLVDRRIEAVSDAVLENVRPGDAAGILAQIREILRRRDSGDIGFELRDRAGRRIGGNVALSRAIPAGFSTISHNDRIEGLTEGRAQAREAGGGLTLITVAETEPIDGLAAVRWRTYLLGFGLIAAVGLAGTIAFGVTVRRRIEEVRATALAIIDGDLSRRVPVATQGGVFAEQARTFNRMLDRIAALVDGLRHVGNDVAHDLRTPLARLRSRVALAAARSPGDEMDAALEQCDELLAIFTAILRIAEIDTGDRRGAFETVDLAALVREVAETLTDVAADDGHRLTIARLDEVAIAGDRQLLSQALLNLTENALHHTPAGTRVTLSVEADAAAVRVVVLDDGPGIAPGDLPTARRRFGRLDPSRHRPGHGLGLPIVEAIAGLHGGTLELADARPGLSAALVLPGRERVSPNAVIPAEAGMTKANDLRS
ncbi:MAG: ATP-binding protein [Sphingomonas adhaesiva]|uniref:sensor histidine kinase n=1 Tax=Sphingomonas adhaesiva TaxID=28212 RepID=UPI002FFA82F4